MLVSMFFWGMLAALAFRMAARRRGFASGSDPPARAATVSSRMMRLKTLARAWSMRAFLRLVVAHFEWPDMKTSSGWGRGNTKNPGLGRNREAVTRRGGREGGRGEAIGR